jgi:outer membrane protein OmpA-like peptidoglycan-associated protein
MSQPTKRYPNFRRFFSNASTLFVLNALMVFGVILLMNYLPAIDCIEVSNAIGVVKNNAKVCKTKLPDTNKLNPENIYFESGESDIPESEIEKLDVFLKRFKIEKKVSISVTGYTNSHHGEGRKSHKFLSLERANKVRQWLQKNGVASELIQTYGARDSELILLDNFEEDEEKSKRVVIKINYLFRQS